MIYQMSKFEGNDLVVKLCRGHIPGCSVDVLEKLIDVEIPFRSTGGPIVALPFESAFRLISAGVGFNFICLAENGSDAYLFQVSFDADGERTVELYSFLSGFLNASG